MSIVEEGFGKIITFWLQTRQGGPIRQEQAQIRRLCTGHGAVDPGLLQTVIGFPKPRSIQEGHRQTVDFHPNLDHVPRGPGEGWHAPC